MIIFQKQCVALNHGKSIQNICINETCKEFRLNCFKCLQNNCHYSHPKDLKDSEDFKTYLQNNLVEFSQFSSKLNIMKGEIKSLFKKFKRFTEENYQITIEKLNAMSINEINEVIGQLVKFQSIQLPLIRTIDVNLKSLTRIFDEYMEILNYKNNASSEVNQKEVEQLMNASQKQNSSGVFEFSEFNSIKEEWCNTISFNQDSSLMIAGYNNHSIKIFDFKNGYIKINQQLKEHKNSVTCLFFMNNSASFISGSLDNNIIVWKQDQNSWGLSQILEGHKSYVICLLINKNDDLIISGSEDKTIKFWINENGWICSQTLQQHKSQIRSISLNESENQLISCAYNEKQLLISQKQQNKEWIVVQKIHIKGYRLCFLDDNQFIVQPYLEKNMYIYQYNNKINKFEKSKHIEGNSCNPCDYLFPQQYIKKNQIIINKYGNSVHLVNINQQNEFNLEQSINFGTTCIYGSSTNDGQFLVTWDNQSLKFKIFQYIQKSERR